MSKEHWKVSESHPKLADRLDEDLRMVMDPELGMDIIQLGLVRDIEIEDGEAMVTMILTTPFCPYAPQLMEACRSQVEETLEMPTEIEMGHEVWNRSFMEEDAEDWGLY
jgi:metal-sulfur cluster biosynthetic enzyme